MEEGGSQINNIKIQHKKLEKQEQSKLKITRSNKNQSRNKLKKTNKTSMEWRVGFLNKQNWQTSG